MLVRNRTHQRRSGSRLRQAATLSRVKRSGLSIEDFMTRAWPAAQQAAESHPRIKALYSLYNSQDATADGEITFRYGLDRVLDGLQIRLKG